MLNETSQDSPLLRLFGRLRGRAVTLLGAEAVARLEVFLGGYEYCRSKLGLPERWEGAALLEEFSGWLEGRCVWRTTGGWRKQIEEVDPSDKNIYTFLPLFDEFMEERDREELDD